MPTRLSAAALVTGLGAASAEPLRFDPSVPQRFVLGSAPGAAAMEGLDAHGSGRSATPLPLAGRVALRLRVPHGIAHTPATDDRSRIVVAHPLPRVSEYDALGEPLWSVRTVADPATSPVILSDRTRLIVLANAELVGLSPSGAQRFRQALPLAEFRAPPLVVASNDGGALISNGHDVLRIGGRGEIIWRDLVTQSVRSLHEWRNEILAVTDAGEILRYRPVTGFGSLASFGGRTPDGAVLSAQGVFSAVVDRHRVVDVLRSDLTRKIRFFEASLTLAGPPFKLDGGESRTLAAEGLLLGHDANGGEILRVALAAAPTLGGVDAFEPPPLFDARGAVAIARRGHDVVLVSPEGQLKSIDGTACGDPIRPTPLAPNALIIGCRSGQIWRVD